MTQRKLYQVVKNSEGGWDLKFQPAGEIIINMSTKKELMDFAVDYCGTHSSVLVILNNNSVIEDAMTFGDEQSNPLYQYQHYNRYLR